MTNSLDLDQTLHSATPKKDLPCSLRPDQNLSCLPLIQKCLDTPTGSEIVCFEVLRPTKTNEVMSSAVTLPNHTFTGQA